MGFLIKSAFWLSLVLLLIPFGGAENNEGQPTVGAIEAFFAARAAIGDMAGLCERQPDVCDVGRSAIQTIGVRTREGARIAYGLLDEHFGETSNMAASSDLVPPVEPIHTGSVPTPSEPVARPQE